MGPEKVRLPAEARIAGILCLAGRMPGVIAASPRRELNWIALTDVSSALRAVPVAFDHILAVQNHGRVSGQANQSAFSALHAHAEKKGVERGHLDGFFNAVGASAGEIQRAVT